MQTVYIEYILLDNFLMDSLLLFFAVRISERRVRLWRIALSALIGAIYSLLAVFFYELRFIAFKVLVSAAMVLLAHGHGHVRGLLLSFAGFYGFSMLAAGGVLLCEYAAGAKITDSFVNHPVLRYLLAGACLALLCTELILRRRQLTSGRRYLITARFGDRTVTLDGALDTGNCLTDLGGNGVILADMTSVLKQLDCNVVSELLQHRSQSFACATVSGENRLRGILPDELIIRDRRHSYSAKGYIALCDKLSFRGCNALLPDNLRIV